MFKFLKDVVTGSGAAHRDLPYNIGEPYSTAWGSWVHYRGTSKDDGSLVSIFCLSGSSAQDGHLAAGLNGVKRLRTVRHPNILSFLYSVEVEAADNATNKFTIYVVTEPVMPLSEKIKELSLEGVQRDEYYAWGLHQIAKAVGFLNNDCKLVHGNVCLTSVVVTETLEWKLHAFDVLSEFDGQNDVSSGALLQYEWLVGTQYKPQELLKHDWTLVRKSPPWALDSWGLGCLIYELFSRQKLLRTDELRNTGCIPKSLLPDYQRLLSSVPSRRLNPSKLIDNNEYFDNKLVETIQFMEVLSLKDSIEKDTFFRKLPAIAEQLPREIVLKKLLPLLSSALEFGSATSPGLTCLLKLGSLVPSDEFKIKILPTIIKLFATNDRAIRVGLLQHIDQYGELLSPQVVDEQVFPHVATGFSDTSAFLRELTLKSVLVLAPKLSQRTISGSLLKYLSKLQVDEEPAIRTNTTILLGNIACYLNDGTRRRVLVNAFTVRALHDSFSPARAAGIMALSATSSYYDIPEVATRILPNIVTLTIDPDSDVREKAFKTIDQFMQLVKQHHEKMVSGESLLTSSANNAAGNGSLLGWAVSSLALKGKVSGPSPVSSKGILAVTSVAPGEAPTNHTQITSETNVIDHPPSPTSTDGWGEVENSLPNSLDGEEAWDDIEPFKVKMSSVVLAQAEATEKRPMLGAKDPGANVSANRDSYLGSSVSSLNRPQSSMTTWCDVKHDDEDAWKSISESIPRKASKQPTQTLTQTDDPWAAIAAPEPTTVKASSLGGEKRGKSLAPKLSIQRSNRGIVGHKS